MDWLKSRLETACSSISTSTNKSRCRWTIHDILLYAFYDEVSDTNDGLFRTRIHPCWFGLYSCVLSNQFEDVRWQCTLQEYNHLLHLKTIQHSVTPNVAIKPTRTIKIPSTCFNDIFSWNSIECNFICNNRLWFH